MILNEAQIRQAVEEINDQDETNRRALSKRRFDIYRDGGRAFLIERIRREFGDDALNEMRVIPINLLKKIVEKRAGIYKRAPLRKAENESDQALVDFYVKELAFDVVMQKANRYMVLASNCVLYIRPHMGKLKASVVPSYQYSLIPNPDDQNQVEVTIFSHFVDEGRVASQTDIPSATGYEGFSQERGQLTQGALVNSNQSPAEDRPKQLIFWSNEEHFTTDGSGNKYADPSMGPEQWVNPIGLSAAVNIARDRDNQVWATQGEDMVDLTIALQMGWTDVMTIAKHQGFSILTIISEEEPKKINIGVNRAVWLRLNPGGSTQPSISYVQGNSPLEQYKGLLMELMGLLLTTNNMEPGAISGSAQARNFTSGFHALIAMADSLEAIESDKPIMLDAELEAWGRIKRWHNWMFDVGMLGDDARSLGKFSEDFQISVTFADVKPLESEDEKIARVEKLLGMKLISKRDAIKKLYPDMTDEQADAKLAEIEEQSQLMLEKFFPGAQSEMSTKAMEPDAKEDMEDERQETSSETQEKGQVIGN